MFIMDLGVRLETGIRQHEICVICQGDVMMGDTFHGFSCGQVVHRRCAKNEKNKKEKATREEK